MKLENVPEGCALVGRAWAQVDSGIDGRAPSKITAYTTDPVVAQKWEKSGYVDVKELYKFTLPNGDVYYSSTYKSVENVYATQLRDRALAKLTPEERKALGF